MTVTSDVERLTGWLDDMQLSNRLGVPHYRNPSELKADIRSLLARLTTAETERDQALNTTQAFLAVLPVAMAEVLHRAHTGWLDGREPDFSEETTRAKLSEVIHREGVADGIPDVPALNARLAAAEARVEAAATVLRIAYDALDFAFMPEKREQIDTAKALIRAHLAARAALACPPQQAKKCPNPYCRDGWVAYEPNESRAAPPILCRHPDCPGTSPQASPAASPPPESSR